MNIHCYPLLFFWAYKVFFKKTVHMLCYMKSNLYGVHSHRVDLAYLRLKFIFFDS